MKKYIIGICLGVLFFSSCSDWLNVEPKTNVKEEDVFSRELGFKEALTGVYIKMASTSLYARSLSYGFIDKLAGRYNWSTGDEAYYEFPSSKNESTVEKIWGDMYNIIANLNNLLYYCDKNEHVFTTENYHDIIKGEALGLRAFLHFDLLRMYGPVYSLDPTAKRICYRTQFNKDAIAMDPSNAVIDSIISDLRKAEILLEDTDTKSFEFPTTTLEQTNMEGDRFLVYRHKRMNIYAVKAMLARVYMYAAGGDAGKAAEYKELAVKYANEVINCGYFNLLANASDVLRSKEIIFSVSVDDFDQQVAAITSTTTYAIMEDMFREIFDIDSDGANDFRAREGVSFESTSSGMKMLKYKQDGMWVSTQNTVVLIRLAEMYYILAECAMDSPETAGAYLDKIREVRGVDKDSYSKDNILDKIGEEYRKEYYGEGQLFFFYKRHAYPTFVNCPMKTPMTVDNYIFNWPDNEILFGFTN